MPPPLLSLDEYVAIVSAGPEAMARALGRYVKPPAASVPEAPIAPCDETSAPETEHREAPYDAPEAETTAETPEANVAEADEYAEEPFHEMVWIDGPDTVPPLSEDVSADAATGDGYHVEMLWHDEAPAPPAWSHDPPEAAHRHETDEPASSEQPLDVSEMPEVMATLTIPMPTEEDAPPVSASEMTDTAPANTLSSPEPEADQPKDKETRRWSWPWRS